ncbi:GATA zinc finger-domain-containing protein [Phycomyces nitens]|nr:GATA zinc finger-domain-containing protein [Phycomyces nitens]
MPYQHHNHHNHQHHQQSPIQPNRLLNNQDTKRHPSLSFSHINESLLKSIQNPCSTGIELQSSSSSTNTANNSISTDIKESLHRACTTEAESASLVETGPNSIPYARRQSSFRSFGYSPISSTNPYSLLKSQSFQVPRRRAFVSTRNTRHSVQLEPTRNHSPTFAQSAKNLCESCGTDSSPEWRRGPSGHKTLCNACGLRYARSVARQAPEK